MRYMAAVLLLVATMSAQNAPTTTKVDGNRGIYCDQGIDLSQNYIVGGHPLKAKHPRHLDIPAISREANGSIVSIVMSDNDGHPIAQGSGFFISEEGCIVTNYHVIKSGSSAIIKLPNGAFFAVDGVLAADKDRDVAIIKAHGNDFRTLTLGDSDRLQVGEEVVAIGNPLSLESTVSNGILSAIRTVEDEGGKFLQITAPISPGSSGGPLFNMAGEVIGITTSHLVGGQNLNFAIPINDVKPMLRWTFSTVKALPNEPEDKPVTAESTTSPSLAIQAQDLTFDGSKNKILQFHRGNLYIEAECDGAMILGRQYDGCTLPGLPGDSTPPGDILKAGADGDYYSLDATTLCFFRVRNGKLTVLDTLTVVSIEKRP